MTVPWHSHHHRIYFIVITQWPNNEGLSMTLLELYPAIDITYLRLLTGHGKIFPGIASSFTPNHYPSESLSISFLQTLHAGNITGVQV